MAGMIKSIFGLTTYDVRKQQEEQRRRIAAQLQQQGTSPFVAEFGTALGQSLGQGLMSKLGMEDPEMARARANEEAQLDLNAKLAELDPTDSTRLLVLSEAMINAGRPDEAARYMSQYESLQQSKAANERAAQQLALTEEKFDYVQQRDISQDQIAAEERARKAEERAFTRSRQEAADVRAEEQLGFSRRAADRADENLALQQNRYALEVEKANLPDETAISAPPVISKEEAAAVNKLIDNRLGKSITQGDKRVLSSDVAQRLRIMKDEYEALQKDTGKAMEWMGDEKAVKLILAGMERDDEIEFKRGTFGFSKKYRYTD